MSRTTLIIGESGTGKSTSIRNLEPTETFVLKVVHKPLPFRGESAKYVKLAADGSTGNTYVSDDYQAIKKVINLVNSKRLDIKTLVIDDLQYSMSFEYMKRATQKGFDKFSEMAQHIFEVLSLINSSAMRDDLNIFVLSHSELDDGGRYKCKTIGKMLDRTITLEGLFTIVLHSMVMNGQYKFLTQNDGTHMAKSPMEMFANKFIDNDLLEIKKTINDYFDNELESL